MADFTLVVGVDTSLSFTEMQSGINEIVSKLNANPPKIKVKFDEASLKTMQSQLNALQANINAMAGRSPVNTASLSEVAAKAGQATSAVQNMNKAISSTSAAAKSASEAERQLKKIADAATQARALLNKNMEASGSASYQKLNAELTKLGTILQTCGGDSTKLSAALKNAGIDGESAVNRLNAAMATLKNELQTAGTQGTVSLRQIIETATRMQALLNSNPQMAGTVQFSALSAQLSAFQEIIVACNGDASALETALHNAGLNGATAIENAKLAMASFKAELEGVTAEEEREAAAVRAAAEAERQQASAEKARELALRAYSAAIIQGEAALRNWTAAENSKNASSRAAYQRLREAVDAMRSAKASYDAGTGSIDNLRAKTEAYKSTLSNTEQVLKANGDATKSLSDRFSGLANKFGAWLSVTQVIMLAVRAMRQMVKASVELDSAMTQMQIVTKASTKEMEAFGNAAAKVAKRTASTITDVVDSATVFARLGYTMDESTQLAEFTTMLQNVGDIDVSDAQDAITSIIKAYDIDASQIESVMDKLVEVGNHFPISVSQIAEGMTNASSTLHAAGNSFEQSVALLTAANTTIQDAAKSSTGLRTIAARIRNTKTELDDLGEVMTEASYEELVQTLTDCGVALTDINGEYRSTYDIMSDIAAKWDTLDSMRQAALATALSGTRQQAVFYSIIENFQEASGAMESMTNSAGALTDAYKVYLDSAQAHIDIFKASFQELAKNFIDAGFIKTVVDFGTTILNILNIVAKLISSLGGLNTVLAVTAGILVTIKADAILATIAKLGGKIKSFGETIALLGMEFSSAFKTAKAAGASSLSALSSGFKAVSASASAAQIAVGAFVAIIAAAVIAVNAIQKAEADRRSAQESAYNAAMANAEESKSLYEVYAAYQSTKSAYEDGIASKEALESAARSLAEALGVEGDAASDTADELERLTLAELDKAQHDAQAAVVEAEKMLSGLMHTFRDSTEKTMIGFRTGSDYYGNYINWNTASEAEQAEALIKVYEQLIQERNEMIDAGETDSIGYDNVISTIEYLEGDVQNLRAARELLNGTQERYNNILNGTVEAETEVAEASARAARDYTAITSKLLDESASDYGTRLRLLEGQLAQLTDEDFAIAQKLVSDGEYSSWNELSDAIETYCNSLQYTVDTSKDALSALWSSEEFEKTRESIVKMASSVDGISAENIEDLASSSEELAAILEVDGINAQFLARILQTEALGGDGFALITEDALILNQALEGMTRRFGEVTEAKSRYDAAMSVPEKDTDFRSMAGAFKELNDQFVAGTTNSNAFWAAAEFLFGTEQLDAWGWEDGLENIYAAMQKNVGVFEDADSAGAGFLERLNEIAEGGKVLGEDGSVIATIEKFADGSFEFDVDALHLSELAEQMGMSEEAVMSCLEALSMWGDIDYYDIQEVLGAIKEIGLSSDNFDGVAVNVSALTDQLISLGYTNKDIHDILTDLQAVDGVTLVDVNASVSSLVDNLTNLGIAASENGTIVIDVQGLANLASDLGMTQGEAETLITKLYEADGITMTNANGEVTSLDDALAALDGKTFTSVTSELDGIASSAQSAETAVQSLQTRINGLTGKTVTITVNEVHRSSILSGITGYASGISNAPAGDAVVGEDGEELVVHKDSAYVAGSHGAEIAHLESGDKVYTADETKRILSSAKQIRGVIPAYSGGSPGRAGGRIGFGGWGSVIGGSGSGSGSGSGGGSGSGSGSGSGHSTGKDTSKEEENWFEKQYKLHNHLIKMCQEDMEDYLAWLNTAYQQAYDEGIIDLDDYRKYQEEVYEGLQDLFKDYLSDVEHEIDMRSMFEGETSNILALYRQLIKDVEKEIAAARAAGLDDTDDYIQELQAKWKDYTESIRDIEEDARDSAKDAVDELIEYRIKMLKQEADKEKDSLKKKLDNLKEFYDKQKKMLQDVYDEEKYLDEQSEKRKSVTDIQAELAQLEFDDSAWAQKRKLQLQEELAEAQKELEDFEKQHALDEALGLLDDAYDAQEKEINAEMEALEEKLNDPEALYNQALADIRNNTKELYEEMLEYNRRHGTGNDEDVSEMWEEAFKSLLEYHDITGEWYKGINLGNYTGYERPQESWDAAPVSEPKPETQPTQPSIPTQPTQPSTPTLTDSIKKHVAAAIWNGNYGWGNGSTRVNRLNEVFGSNNGIQAIVNKGASYVAGTSPSGYSYTDMRKKFKGYASGTRKAAPGMHAVDELGAEYLFASADGNRYRVFSGGEKVLNAKATEFLYEFANSGKDILEKIAKSFMDTNSLDRIQPIVNHNDIHMGDITIQGNADRATVSEIRRAQRESLETMLREFNRLNR